MYNKIYMKQHQNLLHICLHLWERLSSPVNVTVMIIFSFLGILYLATLNIIFCKPKIQSICMLFYILHFQNKWIYTNQDLRNLNKKMCYNLHNEDSFSSDMFFRAPPINQLKQRGGIIICFLFIECNKTINALITTLCFDTFFYKRFFNLPKVWDKFLGALIWVII